MPQEAFPGGANVPNENVFSEENSAADNPGVNGALPNVWGSRQLIANGGINARGLLAVSYILFIVPFWTCTDLRLPQLTQLDAPHSPSASTGMPPTAPTLRPSSATPK